MCDVYAQDRWVAKIINNPDSSLKIALTQLFILQSIDTLLPHNQTKEEVPKQTFNFVRFSLFFFYFLFTNLTMHFTVLLSAVVIALTSQAAALPQVNNLGAPDDIQCILCNAAGGNCQEEPVGSGEWVCGGGV